jgi:chemotaxis protein CheZ
MVAEVVRAVLTTISDDLTAKETSLLQEVEDLARTISVAKTEIAALRVDDITGHDIPFATDELDAIVGHTAQATHAILESCETLDEVAGTVTGEPAAKLQDATTRIYEACSFQDITGQRITKIVATLKTIEGKVAHIINTFGPVVTAAAKKVDNGIQTDADLLNGPQLPEHAMDQSDIDKLMASFE